jgi:carbonic anhydrase/acetyltransferase-like protein (isoleucine patch superfamily)
MQGSVGIVPVLTAGDSVPRLADDVFVAPNATVAGNVEMAPQSSVWFNSVVRGDGAVVRLGVGVDIQDNSVVDSRPGQPCILGDHTSLGHGAAVHASTVGSNVLVAMNATVQAGCTIGDGCIIAANAVVPPGTTVPPGSLVVGNSGAVAREVRPQERERVDGTSNNYMRLAGQYREEIGRGW